MSDVRHEPRITEAEMDEKFFELVWAVISIAESLKTIAEKYSETKTNS